jgi:hypothetical protein
VLLCLEYAVSYNYKLLKSLRLGNRFDNAHFIAAKLRLLCDKIANNKAALGGNASNTSTVIANREAVKQSRRKATITGSSGLLRLWLAMTGVVARNDVMGLLIQPRYFTILNAFAPAFSI